MYEILKECIGTVNEAYVSVNRMLVFELLDEILVSLFNNPKGIQIPSFAAQCHFVFHTVLRVDFSISIKIERIILKHSQYILYIFIILRGACEMIAQEKMEKRYYMS